MMATQKRYRSLSKKFGPGFVALSKRSRKVLAHGRDMQKLWKDAEQKHINFSEIIITHVPKFGVRSLYFIEFYG